MSSDQNTDQLISFRSGADVVTADGDRVGVVRRVVIEPYSARVTHLVVEKGFLFTQDRVLPIELVAETSQDQITLCCGIQDLEEMPEFQEISYVALDLDEPEPARPGDNVRRLYWYPAPGTPWWRRTTALGHPVPIYVEHVEQNIPAGAVALREGANVMSSDGEHMGTLEQVLVDASNERVTDIVVSHGALRKTRRSVPTSWILVVSEDQVCLSIDAELFYRLPEFDDTFLRRPTHPDQGEQDAA